ncbi:22891_t:CDS:2 [Rhizophagus irregularis]|nr:22891_t:CDS:2 [Rhizophagus irregularis]
MSHILGKLRPAPVQAGVVINEFKIDNKYRNEAQVHLDKILKPFEHVLDPEWKNLKDDGIITENYRCITSSLAKIANARVLALNPKNIVICDNSAGGSLSSFLDDECSDYIRNMKRGTANYAGSQASKEYKEKEAALIKNSLVIPYVSPMLAESLGDLPPLLLIAGEDDKFRDEAIYFAHSASEPTKYKGPSYNAGKFEKSPFQTPTNTTLENI